MNIKLPAVALAALLFAGLPLASSSAQIGISVGIAPPAIPYYEQPFCPVEGYLWTPGYWDYADFGYYWVPGLWVAPPRIGVLWTPGYWGYNSGQYFFNEGYWGPTVGFYGGINYGFGYGGRGYYGGEWAGDSFRYNTAVTRVNTSVIRNTYVNKEIVRNNTGSRAGFNGPGGATAKPTAEQQAAAKAEHIAPTSAQTSRVEAAKKDPALHAKNNNGKPKAEAIKALDRNDGPAAAAAGGAAAADKEADAGKRPDADKRAGVEKQSEKERRADADNRGGAEKQSDNERRAGADKGIDPERSKDRATEAANEEQAKRNDQTNDAAAAERSTRRERVESRRSQRPTTRPATSDRAPERAERPAKKKKPANEEPRDER